MLKRLAVGGMAELYLAKDNEAGRLVVIKRILPYLAQEAEFVRMFLDEARIAVQLHHPNIVQMYELGKLEGSIFIAMEFVEGVDLRKILQQEQKRGQAVPPHVGAWLTARLSEGLHYAHHRTGADGRPLGIIHRDVSPQNLMVGYRGEVKLVDFGIAKAAASMERSKPGVIKGKFLYLSPEQLSQERIDHRADLFALGTMLYEVTVGKSPFAKPTTEAVIYAIRAEDPPPPHLIRPSYPQELSRIVMRCLQKDRGRRYQQAVEVLGDLEAWMKREAPTDEQKVVDYVASLFGGEDDRTGIFIPLNARLPDEGSGVMRSPARERTRADAPRARESAPGVNPSPSAPFQSISEETTKPIAGREGTALQPPGRRPTPSGGVVRLSGEAREATDEPETQTVRPREIARALGGVPLGSVVTQPELSRPPGRRNSGLTLPIAGQDDELEPTAISHSGAVPAPADYESSPALTPVLPTEPIPRPTGARPTSDSLPTLTPSRRTSGSKPELPARTTSDSLVELTPSTERSAPRRFSPEVDDVSFDSVPKDDPRLVSARHPTSDTASELPSADATDQQPLHPRTSQPLLAPKAVQKELARQPGATVSDRSPERDPDDEESTADYRNNFVESVPHLPAVKTRPRVNGLLLATVGAIALLVVLLLIWWLGGDAAPPRPQPLGKGETTEAHRGGARESTTEGPGNLAPVKFVAPAGTVIVHDGKSYAPNVVHRVYIGSFTYTYRCPTKHKGSERTINASAQIDTPSRDRDAQVITLCR